MNSILETKFNQGHRENIMDALNSTHYLDEAVKHSKKIETAIQCPLCKKNLILKIRGKSYSMECPADGILLDMRGY